MSSLIKNSLITLVDTTIASGSTDVTDMTILNMAGYDGVTFITKVSANTDTGTVTLKAYGNSTNSTSGATLIGTGTTLTSPADHLLIVLDVYKPIYDYVYCLVSRATQVTELIGGVIAIQYGASGAPVTQGATVGAADLIAQ